MAIVTVVRFRIRDGNEADLQADKLLDNEPINPDDTKKFGIKQKDGSILWMATLDASGKLKQMPTFADIGGEYPTATNARAFLGAPQTIQKYTNTTVALSGLSYNNGFTLSNNNLVCTKSGYYHITAQIFAPVQSATAVNTNSIWIKNVTKNANIAMVSNIMMQYSHQRLNCSGSTYLDAGDAIGLIYAHDHTTAFDLAAGDTFLSVFKLK